MTTFPCFKCDGSGQIQAFSHIANGACFQCGGTGKVSSKNAGVQFTPIHPVIPEGQRATLKQWSYLEKLVNGNDREFCKIVREAGAPMASQIYVSKAVMSKAIDIAKGKGA